MQPGGDSGQTDQAHNRDIFVRDILTIAVYDNHLYDLDAPGQCASVSVRSSMPGRMGQGTGQGDYQV